MAEDTVSSMIGRDIYTESGMSVGVVGDVELSFSEGRVTGIVAGDLASKVFPGEEVERVLVPFQLVSSVSGAMCVEDAVLNSGEVRLVEVQIRSSSNYGGSFFIQRLADRFQRDSGKCLHRIEVTGAE